MEQDLTMEKKDKGSRMEPSKKSLIWLALLLLIGLLTVLLVLMISIHRDHKYIMKTLLPLAEEANVNRMSPYDDFPKKNLDKPSRRKVSMGERDDMPGISAEIFPNPHQLMPMKKLTDPETGKQYITQIDRYYPARIPGYDSAAEFCQKQGAFLPEPKTEQDNNFLENMADDFPLGMKYDEEEGIGAWVWGRDRSPVASLSSFTTDSRLQSDGTEKNCMFFDRLKPGKWVKTSCSRTVYRLVCELPCTRGFTPQGDLCYVYIDTKMTWAAAVNHCRNLDAFLAEPRTQSQIDYLKSVSFTHTTDIWLGATDQTMEGKWVWGHDGADVDGPTDWSPGQPDPWSVEDCLEIKVLQNFMWNDCDCDYRRPFVCQKEMPKV